VPGIGNQRQASGAKTGNGFDYDEQNGGQERPLENARSAVMMPVTVQ
jgi:hypothetical protein